MKTIDEFLFELRSYDIKVWKEGERLLYTGPKGSIEPSLLTQLRERKAEILDFLDRFNPATRGNLSPILPVSRDKNLPLSFAQQRLWFLDQLEGESATYNMLIPMLLSGTLDLPALEQALAEIVSRHESLRTNFPMLEDSVVQVIAETANFHLETSEVPVSGELLPLSPELEQLILEETQRPFNLGKDALFRVKLLRLTATNHILVVTMHHIISDAWSMGVFLQELTTLYAAFSANKPSPLKPLQIQYGDFAHWQREFLSGDRLNGHLDYWRQQLEDIPPLLALPTDHPRPTVQTFKGQTTTFTLTPALSQRIKTLTQQSQATVFMTLLAAFQLLLHRYTRQEDIIVGSPIANRQRQELEPLLGCFVNTLVMRTQFKDNPTFTQVLAQVRQTALDAYSHQDLPFEKLVEELQPERSLSHSPLFQVMFVWQNTPRERRELPGLKITPIKRNRIVAKFDLTLLMTEVAGDSFVGFFEYNSDLFEAETIERMVGHFQTLLSAIVENPQQRVSELPLLRRAERHQLLVEWNQTDTEYPQAQCIHQLFEEQVIKTSNNIAVVFEEEKLTYQQLNEQANQLAHYLQKLGVKKYSSIGIFIERSPKIIISMLAILKLGCVYIPLEGNYPQERLEFMLEDADVNLVITEANLEHQLSEYQGNIVNLDIAYQAILNESKLNLGHQLNAENLAYVIYTSGSTGKPKGVKIKHKSVTSLVLDCNYVSINSNDKIAQIANTSFDAATFEIWGALLNGANLVIFSQDKLLELDLFVEQLKEQKIDTIFITTALFNQIANLYPQNLQTLNNVLFGGEKSTKIWIKKILKEGKPEKLIHVYGPTENTTFSTYYDVNVQKIDNNHDLPIGKPINNTQVYILDSDLQAIPIGVTGEIYLAGEGIAEGYLNRPELTAEKFIDNPFGKGKLYKTGDLARYLPDGNIEFIGRIDEQVKIRGFRIELGEVENNLLQHPNLEEVLIIINQKEQEKQLIAYIVPTQEKVPTKEEIKQFLKQKLPEYMIPNIYIPLEAFPLTPNGKIDKKALALPERQHSIENEFIPPQTATEKKLAKIWQKILWKDEEIGINDNFFDLGGHSLLSVRLVAEIEQQFQQKLPLKALFQLSTVKELAKILEQENQQLELDTPELSNSKLNPEIYYQILAYTSGWKGQKINPNSPIFGHNLAGKNPPLFWVLQGYRELSQLAKYLGENQPVYGMRSGHLIMKYTKEDVEDVQALAKYYAQEIIKIQVQEPYYIGGNCQSSYIATEIAKQIQKQGKKIELLFLLENVDRYRQPYQGKIALIWARNNIDIRFSPYCLYQNPELGWNKFYPAGYEVITISGKHGEYFDEPNVQDLANKINWLLHKNQAEINKAENSSLNNQNKSAILTSQGYQAEIKAPDFLSTKIEEKIAITLTIKNISPETWEKTEKSGIRIGNHWRDTAGNIVKWSDGRVNLEQDLESQQEIKSELEVTAPEKEGKYLLEIDLVEEGITWFKYKGSKPANIVVKIEQNSQIKNVEHTNIQEYIEQGNVAYEKGDIQTAINYYEQVIKAQPDLEAKVILNLGLALAQNQKTEKAINYLEKALLLTSNNPKICYELGKLYEKKENVALALANYQLALKYNHETPWIIYEKIGKILSQKGDIDRAIIAYQEGIKQKPDYLHIYGFLGSLQLHKGKIIEAISLYEKGIELAPDAIGLYLALANAQIINGEVKKAEQSINKVLKMDKKSAQAYLLLGTIEENQGDLAHAKKYYQKAIELDENQESGYLLLAQTLMKKNGLEEAGKIYQKVLSINPELFWANKSLGDIYQSKNNLELAKEYLEKAQKIEPNNPYSYSSLGNLYQQMNDLKLAIVNYKKAVDLGINNFHVYKQLGDCLKAEGKREEAIDVYKQVLKQELNQQELRVIIEQIETTVNEWQKTVVNQNKLTINYFKEQQEALNKNKILAVFKILAKILKILIWFFTGKLKENMLSEKAYKVIAQSDLFDIGFYLANYPDVAEAKIDPLWHYVKYYYEGRNPSRNFDTNFYLSQYPDVAEAKINPLYHYLVYGRNEGRLPSR